MNVLPVFVGLVSPLAGGDAPGFANGVGSEALFNDPQGIARSAVSTNIVYVCDAANKAIRSIDISDGTSCVTLLY